MMRNGFFMSKTAFFLWLIHPLFSLYYGLRHIKDPHIFPVLALFSFFFGMTFVVPEDKDGAADSARYATELKELHHRSLGMGDVVDYLYNSESGKIDVYQPLLTWLLSYLTDNPQWLFAVFGLVFGWFWFKNIQLITEHLPQERNYIVVLLLLLFALLNPIWEINGVRMWTAAQIFVYGLLLVFLNNEKRGYFYCIGSLLVHFSFALPLLLLLAYRFLPKQIDLFFAVYVMSFFVRELNVEALQKYFELLPDFLQTRKGYISDASMEQFQEMQETGGGLSWHVRLAEMLHRYFFLLFAVLLYLGMKARRAVAVDNFVKNLFLFALFFSAFANVAANLPSGGRYLTIANSVLLVGFILFYSRWGRQSFFQNFILNLTSLPLFFLLLFKLRTGMDFISILTIVGNPVVAALITDNVPLIDFIKSLL